MDEKFYVSCRSPSYHCIPINSMFSYTFEDVSRRGSQKGINLRRIFFEYEKTRRWNLLLFSNLSADIFSKTCPHAIIFALAAG